MLISLPRILTAHYLLALNIGQVRSDSFFQDVETLNIMNREDLTYFLFVNSKLNELLHREDLQKLAEEDNPIIILME